MKQKLILGRGINGKGIKPPLYSAAVYSLALLLLCAGTQAQNTLSIGQALSIGSALSVTSGPAIPTSGLLAWYPLNEGSGIIAHDLSGNSRNGDFIPGSSPEWISSALYFNGNSRVALPDLPLAGAVPATFAFNLRIFGQPGILGIGVPVSLSGLEFVLNYPVTNCITPYPSVTAYAVVPPEAGDPWQHITYTTDGTNSEWWTNGVKAATFAYAPTFTGTSAALGWDSPQTAYGFNGYLADVLIYNRTLSTQEISTVYSLSKK
jgi:hypothetical protein